MKEEVDFFFDLRKSEWQKVKFDPTNVYNVNETGISIVQGPGTNAVSVKGKNHVARLSLAERSSLMTFVTCVTTVRLLIVFPRARMKPELLNDNPPGTVAAPICQDGYKHVSLLKRSNTFLKWSGQGQTLVIPIHTQQTQRSSFGDDKWA
jgi:hypothetical protein